MKTILIIGATSSIAQACVQQWCILEKELAFILVARDQQKLQDFSQNLVIRYPHISIHQRYMDLRQFEQVHIALNEEFKQSQIDIALIAQGLMYVDESSLEFDQSVDLIGINSVSVAVCLDVIYKNMIRQNIGKIGVISSVAGDRGRKANYLYGASKSFISTYVEGLQHRIALLGQNIHVSLIKPGPTASLMTQHLVEEGKKLANVDDVAKIIVEGVEHKKRIIYSPKIWFFIMFIIKKIPFFLFKKLDI